MGVRPEIAAEYRSWANMKNRCLNPRVGCFKNYGARGIKVCDRWLKFKYFIIDMGKKPSPRHTLERIDNNGNYEPGNCRWATRSEQGLNTRRCRWIEFGGSRKTITQWARQFGISHRTLAERIDKWPLDRAMTAPRRSWR